MAIVDHHPIALLYQRRRNGYQRRDGLELCLLKQVLSSSSAKLGLVLPLSLPEESAK